MALRTAQVLIGVLVRAGVFCLAPGAASCIAHGLPSTPDSITFCPMTTPNACVNGGFLQSWDGTSIVFMSSHAAAYNAYVRIAVEATLIA